MSRPSFRPMGAPFFSRLEPVPRSGVNFLGRLS
jgi:hypothetical protein